MFWLLIAGVVAVVASGGGTAMVRRGPKVKVAGPGGKTVDEASSLVVGQVGSWVCARGKKIPIPTLSSILPAQLVQSNVILAAAEAMIGVLKSIVDGLGFGTYNCTVLHGKTIFLAQVRGPHVAVHVEASVGWSKRAHHAVRWTFSSLDISSSGEVPVSNVIEVGDTPTVKSVAYDGNERAHLRDGAAPPWAPPKSACNTICIGGPGLKWLTLPEAMRVPHVWLVRTGEDIRVWIYIPPRSGYYTSLDVHGQGKRDDDIEWRVEYRVRRVDA